MNELFQWVGSFILADMKEFGKAKGWIGEPQYTGQIEGKGAMFEWPDGHRFCLHSLG